MQQVNHVKGTRDFHGIELKQKNYVLDIIKSVFENYGFEPLETPAFENLSTLTNKYGEEGDKLIYKILNSGDFLKKIDREALEQGNYNLVSKSIVNKALKYDLTIPFARFVSENKNKLVFPFKRYQTQSVWRADRPQKGRYREFYQCDADCVGSESIWQEIEFIHLYDDVFNQLNLKPILYLNNRKLLFGLAQSLGVEKQFIDFTIALDKLDKIGREGVVKELIERGIKSNVLDKINFLFNNISSKEKLEKISALTIENDLAKKGLSEISFISQHFDQNKLKSLEIILDFTLARGLDYYTGSIFEVKIPDSGVGSVAAGGRYSNLTKTFGANDLPGIGISFGLDRILHAMEETNAMPDLSKTNETYLFINFSEEDTAKSFPTIQKMRDKGFAVSLYPEAAKLKKQFQYADKKDFTYIVLHGEDEQKENILKLKKLKTGEYSVINLNAF